MKYSAKPGRGNNPVNFVSWYDAIRFTNWLHNDQGGPGTTENGAYTLPSPVADPRSGPDESDGITRNPGAKWFLPTQDEWYKAAYHKQDGVTGNYWDFPTATDDIPYSDQPPGSGAPDPSNTANFSKDDGNANGYDDGYAVTGFPTDVSSQNYLTNVGTYALSASSYGTFDQGGNLWELNETPVDQENGWPGRGVRGGSWANSYFAMHVFGSDDDDGNNPAVENHIVGFRVATFVPEPSALLLGMFAAIGLLLRQRN